MSDCREPTFQPDGIGMEPTIDSLVVPISTVLGSTFGEMIKNGRKAKGFSLRTLAAILGVSYQLVYQIEQNRLSPARSIVTVEMLAAALNLDAATLHAAMEQPKKRKFRRRSASFVVNPDAPETLGGFLFKKREECGLTQQALADRAGISVTVVSGVERGRRVPGRIVLTKLVKEFGCEIPDHLAPVFWHGVHECEPTVWKKLGAYFKAQRKALGITQAALARRAKISLGSVNAAEVGSRPIGRKVYLRISRALRCDVPDDLVPVFRKLGRPKRS